ncbi:MAG TPA: hypothetical protein VMU90_02975, partial [Solirubrobacteraceae bacterium]|nr:hypothetical protein [Solirubrobacteraceae bacterium]
MTTIDTTDLDTLVRREHHDPHSILGAHPADAGVVIRAYRPGAGAITAQVEGDDDVELEQIHPAGVFEGLVEGAELPVRYRLEVDYGNARSFTIDDPYSFEPTLGELDIYLAGEGRHEQLYEKLGAHVREIQSVQGTAFA